jgi:cytoskeleton protein RodZ
MSENNNNDAHKDNLQQGVGPGDILAGERKKLNIDEKDAAYSLKISIHRLRAIEANNFTEFPSETYIRGYLRNYSRVLNVDEQLVLSAYERAKEAQATLENRDAVLSSADIASHSHKQWWKVYVALLLLVLLWVLSYAFWGGSSHDPDKVSVIPPHSAVDFVMPEPPLMPAEPVAVESPPALIAETPALPVDTIADTPETPQPLVVSSLTAAELIKSVVAAPPPDLVPMVSLVSEGDTLAFSFENQCWVKVTDADGSVIFAGLQSAGSQLNLSGKAPFRVIVGNVDGTTLVYNGQSVELVTQGDRKALSIQVGG